MEKKEPKRCSAKSKRTGEQCKRWASAGFDVCYYHGAGGSTPEVEAARRATLKPGHHHDAPPPPPPPRGNQKARKHGGYTAVLLPDEQAEKDRLVQKLSRSLGEMDDFDYEALDILCLCLTKVRMCSAAGAPAEAVLPWAKHAMEQMRELKATRASKDSGALMGNTPADVMAALFLKVTGGQQPDPVDRAIPVEAKVVEALPADNDDLQDPEA